MGSEKKIPLFSSFLGRETEQRDRDAAGELSRRLERYATAHSRAIRMADWIKAEEEEYYLKQAGKLRRCGSLLVFREYYTVGKTRLHAADFCKQHLLCPLCAIRRAAKAVKAYSERVATVAKQDPSLRLSFVTYTIRDRPDLTEGFQHLKSSWLKLMQLRRDSYKGQRPCELSKALGGVGSFEFKRGKNSGLWHPHFHGLILHRDPLDYMALKREWEGITKDSHQVWVRQLQGGENPIDGFLETFKYALKFSDLPLADNWEAYRALRRRRLVTAFGNLRGVEVDESMTDPILPDDLPYIEMTFRYLVGSGYNLIEYNGAECA